MNKCKKVIAGVVAVAVSAGVTTSIAYANNNGSTEVPTEKNNNKTSVSDTKRTSADGSVFKDETVYVLCNKDSSVKNIIVSDWLKDTKALSSVSDISDLKDIENVKGYEEFMQSGNELDWNADGNDIYYKGTSDKDLPVDVNVEYFLDGKKISLDKLTGKSGHVTIRWTYTNNQKVTKNINGKKKIFMCLS